MTFVYTCGFNAHSQLFPWLNMAPPFEDIKSLTEITHGDAHDARILFAGWGSTVLLLDDTILLLGHFENSDTSETQKPLEIQLPYAEIKTHSHIRSVFGDLNGPLGLLTWTGQLYAFSVTADSHLSLKVRGDASSPTLSHIAITGTDRTAIIMLQARDSRMIHILEFETFKEFEGWYSDPSGTSAAESTSKSFTHHIMSGRAVTLLAGATCFVLLTEESDVFSWGDGRHSRCLGRTPETESPANKPYLVSALGGIPISKIEGRGWFFGALSKEHDLYLWGRDKPGTETGLGQLLGNAEEEVKLVDDVRFEDVQDFAIGNGHVLIGTAQGEIYAIGENSNGQCGLGQEAPRFLSTWEKVASVQNGQRLNVNAGDASSLVLSTQIISQMTQNV